MRLNRIDLKNLFKWFHLMDQLMLHNTDLNVRSWVKTNQSSTDSVISYDS